MVSHARHAQGPAGPAAPHRRPGARPARHGRRRALLHRPPHPAARHPGRVAEGGRAGLAHPCRALRGRSREERPARRTTQEDRRAAGRGREIRTMTEWTCPMHPDIVRDGPGSCPKCGMALEPRTITAGDEENPELTDMSRRFWIGALLTLPLLAVMIAELLPANPLHHRLRRPPIPSLPLPAAPP